MLLQNNDTMCAVSSTDPGLERQHPSITPTIHGYKWAKKG